MDTDKEDSVLKDSYLERIKSISRHIKNVQENGLILAERLIEAGELELARKLVQRCFRHDNSKFYGIEWEYLCDKDNEFFKQAVHQHQLTNDHHIEYHVNIQDIPEETIAEISCDLCARGSEMGSDVRGFVKEKFTKKHNINYQSKFYKSLKKYIDLILIDKFL